MIPYMEYITNLSLCKANQLVCTSINPIKIIHSIDYPAANIAGGIGIFTRKAANSAAEISVFVCFKKLVGKVYLR